MICAVNDGSGRICTVNVALGSVCAVNHGLCDNWCCVDLAAAAFRSRKHVFCVQMMIV